MCLHVMWGFYGFLNIHVTWIMNLLYRKLLILCGCQADFSPVPLTPDYGGPVVRYADGVFDPRFGRYVTVQEGSFFEIFRLHSCMLHSYALVISFIEHVVLIHYSLCRSS